MFVGVSSQVHKNMILFKFLETISACKRASFYDDKLRTRIITFDSDVVFFFQRIDKNPLFDLSQCVSLFFGTLPASH